MVRAVLTAGLGQNVMKMAKMLESGGYRSSSSQTQRKRVRTGFKTIQDGRVFIHPSSVNSEKNFPSNWFVYYEKVKTSKVFIRDCTLIHPLTLLLFAGRSLDLISREGGKVVIGLDGKNWFAFEVSESLADLLRCGRRAVEATITAGLTGRLGRLSLSHRLFLTGLNTFLLNNTGFDGEAMVRAVLTAGLGQNVMKMAKMLESGGYRSSSSQTQRKRVRTGFKTIQDGRVFIHPSSVNSEKNFPSNWFVYYEKVKTSKVFIRDCTLIHPLTLLLFAGKSLDLISREGGKVVIGLDGKNWFAFEVSESLADLLMCGRRAVEATITAGLTGRLGRLSLSHRLFLTGLNTFLLSNTGF